MTTMIPTIYLLDPDADLDFGFEWTDWLVDGETIVTSTWTVDPTDPETGLAEHDASESDGITMIWLKEITVDVKHRITNKIVTSSTPARTDERSFYVKGVQR